MPTNQLWAPARFATRLLGRSVFLGLLTLALAVAIVSFLTACWCDRPFITVTSRDIPPPSDGKTTISPCDVPVAPPANTKKDN